MRLGALALAAALDVAAPAVRQGEISDPIVCAPNPTMSYALYLPKAFTPERSWPILFVFDPRARGALAAEVFREVAERRGFIIASSNNTESDNPKAPNAEAIDALWRDALSRLPVDPKRIYATGYSGGARLACAVGYSLKGGLAGVIAVGGGFPPDLPPVKALPFVVFGTAGLRDFNYFEMTELDATLEKFGVAHRFESFDGGHEWPPAAVAAQALEWMDLQGVRTGRLPADAGLVASYWERESQEARAHEGTGRAAEAFVTWRNLAQDLATLRDVSEATAAVERLRAVAEPELKRRDKIDKSDQAVNQKNRRILETLRSGDGEPILTRLVADLGIEALRKAAAGQGYEALSAQRRLAEISPLAGSYIPKELMERGEYRRALACYGIAAAVRPEAAFPQFNLARAHARLGAKRHALAALGRALDKGFDDRARFENDPDLASLRPDPAWATLLARLPKS